MATSKWIYRMSDGMFTGLGGFYDPIYDPATEAIAEFPDANPHPDRRLFRANSPGASGFDNAKPKGHPVPASAQEIADFDAQDPHTKRETARQRLREKRRSHQLGITDMEDIVALLGVED